MNDKTRLFAQFVCVALAFVAMVILSRFGRATRAPSAREVAAGPSAGGVAPAQEAGPASDDCTGTAGFWAWSTDIENGTPVRKMECRRYA